ncbi:hypothetical protein IHV12_15210 [Fictibacillus sp. 7GRE50]|uniref:hypothetical protein n=1 Tax=Fictibacillus sp. 7GRE50 TaxID=2745878 RepID=UPI0018CEC8C7|nr:hypothetical protein [Fictibacillus sp. 7GRE50]MBH0166270.1 hypothetical protein [Fictibacillus sp. 7GRE50]
MKDMLLELIKVIFPASVGLIGAFLGIYFTRKTQNDLFDKEIKKEEQKEKRLEVIDALDIYSRVLKLDGENTLVTNGGGGFYEFDITLYLKEVRPILYEKFYLLHEDIAEYIIDLDERIQNINYEEQLKTEDDYYLQDRYFDLIKAIKSHLSEFRSKNIYLN